MKHVLITGSTSYVGNQVAAWLNQFPEDYQVSFLSLRGDQWRSQDLSAYDVVVNCVGIAHNSSDPSLEDMYYRINRDLTIEFAQEAKRQGVQHFIHLSSMIVYGSKVRKITANTMPDPDNFYGDSKWQADQILLDMRSPNFHLTLVRPPMIYGPGSKGNYPRLAKLAQTTPFFVDFPNQRSMLYVGNLVRFIQVVTDHQLEGIYHPQNQDYIQTSQMVGWIADAHQHRMIQTRAFNWLIRPLMRVPIIRKVFGDYYYDQMIDGEPWWNQYFVDNQVSVEETENSSIRR